MGEVLERCRRDEHRHGHLVAQDRHLRRDRRDVHEHARTQVPAPEGGEVLRHRALVSGSAGDVPPRSRLDLALGEALEVPGVQRLRHAAADPKGHVPGSDPRARPKGTPERMNARIPGRRADRLSGRSGHVRGSDPDVRAGQAV